MTVQANLPPTNTNSDGVTTTFNYGFKVTREEHLKAMYTVIATGETGDLEIDSVTGVGNDGGGTVTFATAPADGMIITVDSIAPLSQIEAFTGNKLPPATVERMGDAIAIQNQRQQSQIERSVRFPASDDQIPTLPAKAQRADKILGFSADGSDFAMVEGAAASQAYVDQAEAQADRAVAAATYPYTGGEQKTGAFMPGAGESLTLFTYKAVSDAAVTLPALAGLAVGYNIGICRTAGSGDLTISAADGALINGASSVVLASDYLCLDLTINEAGDEWVAVDKALIGLPVGTSANDIVAVESDGKLPEIDGSKLTNVRDDTARDTALISYIKSDIALNSPGGVYGKIISDNFIADTLASKVGATYNMAGDYYTNDDASVLVLTHFDGADAATAATEETGKTLTFSGNAQLDTAQKKFGTASLLLDGTGDYVSISDTAGLLGTSDFTIECFAYISSSVSNKAILGCRSGASGNNQWTLFVGSTAQTLSFHTSSTAMISNAGSIPTAAWVHVAAVRSSGTTTLYIGGSSVGSSADSNNYNGGSVIYIGRDGTLDSVSPFLGWIDEVRVCNTAKYTGNFTPPAAPLAIAGDMTLVSTAETLEMPDPSDFTAMFRVEDVDEVTDGTDRVIQISIDDGVTWATASIQNLGAYGDDDKLIKATADVSAQAGDQYVWKLATANEKLQRIKQVAAVPEY